MSQRLRAASRFALKHLAVSVLIAAACAALVFGLWYPYPYSELAGGRELFLLVVSVDVVIGPLLSLVVYDPAKPRRELWRDLGVIFALQLLALGYGMASVAQARPVLLAFEGDRFRIVAAPDVDPEGLDKAPGERARIGWAGPKKVAVRLLEATDPEFPQSIKQAMEGLHPAFRPQRWVDYDRQRTKVVEQAKPLSELKKRQPAQAALIDAAVRDSGLAEAELGYLPLASRHRTDWIVGVRMADGEPVLYLPVDGW